jgi:aryl-alcohol dehydrogenase-like predicted oxidoreductase
MNDKRMDRSIQAGASRLGFGCSRIFGGLSTKQSEKLIEAALSVGIRHFDVAPCYGDGTAETVLGSVLAGVDNVTIATKYGLPATKTSFVGASLKSFYRQGIRPILAKRPSLKQHLLTAVKSLSNFQDTSNNQRETRVLSVEEILIGVEQSLSRLRRDRIEMFLIHEPDQFVLNDQLRLALDQLIASGRIGAYGLGYGREVANSPAFGSVLQCKFDDDLHPRVLPASKLMLHGVIGRFKPKAEISTLAQRVQRLKKAIITYDASIVLFSASSPAQIRQVSEMFEACHH